MTETNREAFELMPVRHRPPFGDARAWEGGEGGEGTDRGWDRRLGQVPTMVELVMQTVGMVVCVCVCACVRVRWRLRLVPVATAPPLPHPRTTEHPYLMHSWKSSLPNVWPITRSDS